MLFLTTTKVWDGIYQCLKRFEMFSITETTANKKKEKKKNSTTTTKNHT